MIDPHDEQLEQRIRRLLSDAGGGRPGGDVRLPTDRRGRSIAVGQRWMIAVAIALVGVGATALIMRNPTRAPEISSSPPTAPAPNAETSTSTIQSTSTSAVPPTSATVDKSSVITRPYVDPAVCGNGSKTVFVSDGGTYVPFALGPPGPIPLQVVAAPTDGVAKPFAVVLRLFDVNRDFVNDHPVVINGVNVYVKVKSNGDGTAGWTLADGSQGYVRTRGLDQVAIESLISRLTPRDRTAQVPGFEVGSATDGSELVLLHEGMNSNLSGTTTIFECKVASPQTGYRVRAIEGDPLFVYFGIIDAPRPYAVGPNGDGAITIEGGIGASGLTLEQVRDADPETWASLPETTYS